MNDAAVSLYAVGDVCVNREDPEGVFAFVAPVLNEADVSFCQLETLFSERGSPSPVAASPLRSHPRNIGALQVAGFDVVSMAGNHVMDFGADALTDTIELLGRNNMRVVGAGQNIDEARQPVIVERKGIRTAFLAYCSILPHRYWADADRPGCVPIRVSTLYEPVELGQPGCPAKILTFADKDDLEAMRRDIAKARVDADVIVMSIHWGLHYTPGALATYQREVAHAAIDAGVDLILGTHAHILKGIEVYKSKVIAYSLCNFAFDLDWTEKDFEKPRFKDLVQYYPNRKLDKDYPSYPFPVDSRKTLLLKCMLSKAGVERVSFLPAYVNGSGQPELLKRDDARSLVVFDYMNDMCKELGTRLSFEGDEVLIHAD